MSIISNNILAGASGAGITLPEIGAAYEGGYYAGAISHTANGVATHALVVAPAATGATGTGYTLTTMKKWSTSDSTTNATSPYDGAANTALMTGSPAADFCTGLTIGGYSDWYLPANYELDIAYYNLKPTTNHNNVSWGINDYSVPKRTANYTSGSPAQTSVSLFQSGSSEAFVDDVHWSSVEVASTHATYIFFSDGRQGSYFKQSQSFSAMRVRAFRKVAL
jgi:hypothetical protein